jgi:hypothetical protein
VSVHALAAPAAPSLTSGSAASATRSSFTLTYLAYVLGLAHRPRPSAVVVEKPSTS